jgi:hypothetical protein
MIILTIAAAVTPDHALSFPRKYDRLNRLMESAVGAERRSPVET